MHIAITFRNMNAIVLPPDDYCTVVNIISSTDVVLTGYTVVPSVHHTSLQRGKRDKHDVLKTYEAKEDTVSQKMGGGGGGGGKKKRWRAF